jgi:hypothetical protein
MHCPEQEAEKERTHFILRKKSTVSQVLANKLESLLVETFNGAQHLHISARRSHEIYDNTGACII